MPCFNSTGRQSSWTSSASSQYASAVGLPIVFQALINMGVAVQLFPVTGQPLPLISTGGTSIWTTFFAFGVLLSVSRNNANIMELDLSENVNE